MVTAWSGTDWTLTTDDPSASVGEVNVSLKIFLEYYPNVESLHTFKIIYLHICEQTALSLTNDPPDISYVSGTGPQSVILGPRSNTEAVAQGDVNFCGAYSVATISTSYPAAVDIPSASSLIMTVDDLGVPQFG